MATKNRSVRCDDEVWAAICGLAAEFGTINLGLRVKLGLGKVKAPAKDEEGREGECEMGDV